MESNNKYPTQLQAGFTLVEVMVGLTIGLLATVIIMQVFTVFEAQKRTTTGTADAQTNGNIALYQIQRELQMAGYPLMPYGQPGVPDSAIECTTLTVNGTLDTNIPNKLSPVIITDGGAGGGSDSITIRYGDSLDAGIAAQITTAPVTSTSLPAPAIDVPVSSNLGCKVKDTVVVVNGAACAMTSVPASGIPAAPNFTTISLPDNSTVTAGVAVPKANLSCLGNWNDVTYSVANGNLVRTVIVGAVPVTTPVVPGIVNLQAQYGISAAGLSSSVANFNQVQQWVDATGTWAAPGVTDRNRIKAVRLAVVARNAKKEIAAVTAPCSVTAPNGPCSWDATTASAPVASPAPAVDLNTLDPAWTFYRYRIFDTIIPLRNVIWSRGTL